MRAIEFRAWDNNKMHYFVELTSFKDGSLGIDVAENGYHDLHTVTNSAVLMQYTGLKDAKGNKVFEGDVLARDGFPNAEVYFHGLRWYPAIDPEHHIVIGNKYQHGELLNEQKIANIGTDRDG